MSFGSVTINLLIHPKIQQFGVNRQREIIYQNLELLFQKDGILSQQMKVNLELRNAPILNFYKEKELMQGIQLSTKEVIMALKGKE